MEPGEDRLFEFASRADEARLDRFGCRLGFVGDFPNGDAKEILAVNEGAFFGGEPFDFRFEQAGQLNLGFGLCPWAIGRLAVQETIQKRQVPILFAPFVHHGGARNHRQPTPKFFFTIERFYMPSHAHESLLQNIPGHVFAAAGQDQEITQEAPHVEVVKKVKRAFLALAKSAG